MIDIKQTHVFLCHASEDKPAVRKLYERLTHDGINAWLDEEKLLPGQDWQLEISKAVKASDAIIVFLSSRSVKKSGFVQKEIKLALDVAKEKPEGTIFFIPARLDECDVPNSLQAYQWVNLFDDKGYERIKKALITRLNLPESESPSYSSHTKIVDPKPAQVTIIIEKDILQFTEKEKDSFVFAISKLTGVSSNQIRILQVSEGSVVITLEMPEIGVKRLMELYYKNDVEIEKLGVSKISLKMNSNEQKELLGEHVRLLLDQLKNQTTIEIYSHIRKVLPEKIAQQIWLYAIIENDAIFISETVTIASNLKAASEREFPFKESRLELDAPRFTELDKVFSKIAINENKSMVGDIFSADYPMSSIELAEKAIYQSDQFIIQPLVREGKTLLTAAYPSNIRPQVEFPLEEEKEKIKQIIISNKLTFHSLLKKIDEGGFLSKLEPKYFEYTGAFIRSLFAISS